MGLAMSLLYDRFFTRETRALMLGLDGAGKTTLIYKLKLNEMVQTVPTIGFNVENVRYRNLELSIWDVGGQDKIRALWKHYFLNTDVLIFVVDSNDAERLAEARDELRKVLEHPDMPNPLVLVYANKVDLPSAMSTSKVADGLQLHTLKSSIKWFIQPSSAATGVGVMEGLQWLSEQMKHRPLAPRAGA